MNRKQLAGAACLALALSVASSRAVRVRVATWNVQDGVGTPGEADYASVVATLQRINPDIIAFQELNNGDFNDWISVAAALGYPYYAMGDGGTFDAGKHNGFFSRFPILSTEQVREPAGAAEINRWPLKAVIEIPGALNPLTLYSLHNKSASGETEDFMRAIELRRTIAHVSASRQADPIPAEYVVMGDFNADVGVSQREQIPALPGGLPAGYVLGADVTFPVAYRLHPTDPFAGIQFSQLEPFQEDSILQYTHLAPVNPRRYDYICFSEEVAASPYGAPAGEIYYSIQDDGQGGLLKFSVPPPAETSANASDHLPVYADINMIDLLPCYNPVVLISEVASAADPRANFVELYNSGVAPFPLAGYRLVIHRNGAEALSVDLNGSIPAGSAFVLAADAAAFAAAYGVAAGQASAQLLPINGNDPVTLLNPAGAVQDAYGAPGQAVAENDFSMPWAYPQRAATRVLGTCDPLPQWRADEWSLLLSPTPGAHTACDQAGVFVDAMALQPAAPRFNEEFRIRAAAHRNLLADGLAAVALYRWPGQSWTEAPMSLLQGELWESAAITLPPGDASSLEYAVRVYFNGPNAASPLLSAVRTYVFPPFVGPQRPLISEVQANDAGGDDAQFVELVAPAGLNLRGYALTHHDGNDSGDNDLWPYVFGDVIVPNDGLADIEGRALGFVVVGQAPVANVDLLLPGDLQNGPDGLVLTAPDGAVADAVAWGGAGDLAVDDPGTVRTDVASSEQNYLHVLPGDTDADTSLQAPNDVYAAAGAAWALGAATPGAVNARQASGAIRVQPANPDRDADGIPNEQDNCPDTFNPVQADIDRDLLGDECDPDKDGDGALNAADNCPCDRNPDQADLDHDGLGNACDNDRDGDGVSNDEDNCPDTANPDQADADHDGIGDACDSDLDGDGVANISDNCPNTPNSNQADADRDGVGDACDNIIDSDRDGIADASDNCPSTPNPDQADADHDGIGDACDNLVDTDRDGVADASDNCRDKANPGQEDLDHDGIGDACDSDLDGDGVANISDNCPNTPNSNQADADRDGVGDACDNIIDSDRDGIADASDNCPSTPNPDQADADHDGIGDACDNLVDTDRDGVADASDNCRDKANPGQEDLDHDGIGDACDSDLDGDGVANQSDNCPVNANPDQADLDGNGRGDACDVLALGHVSRSFIQGACDAEDRLVIECDTFPIGAAQTVKVEYSTDRARWQSVEMVRSGRPGAYEGWRREFAPFSRNEGISYRLRVTDLQGAVQVHDNVGRYFTTTTFSLTTHAPEFAPMLSLLRNKYFVLINGTAAAQTVPLSMAGSVKPIEVRVRPVQYGDGSVYQASAKCLTAEMLVSTNAQFRISTTISGVFHPGTPAAPDYFSFDLGMVKRPIIVYMKFKASNNLGVTFLGIKPYVYTLNITKL
ncbi:MAG TPA: thrombospondin type 3 repeat-containing protein [Kiritimatiellia bacterium]|nr:thrombospondin type 3 repeat-containing protein [Kiritimatiellia bacterium]